MRFQTLKGRGFGARWIISPYLGKNWALNMVNNGEQTLSPYQSK